MEVLSIVLSIIGIVVSVGAVALAVLFYRWADAEAKRAATVFAEVKSAADRLEAATANLQRDSFGLVRSSLEGVLALAAAPGAWRPADQPADDAPAEPPANEKAPRDAFTDKDLRRAVFGLGEHMRKKRGAEFPAAIKDLRARILHEAHSAGRTLTNSELGERIGDDYDIGEVVYAAYGLGDSGALQHVPPQIVRGHARRTSRQG